MDDTDIKILTILQKKATIPLSELSKIVGITPTPCWNRIKKMEEEKIIISKVTLIDNKKVNLPIVAFLSIQITNHTVEWLENFKNIILKHDQIVETHRVNGSYDYILKILSTSVENYDIFQQNFIRETGCTNMQTSFSQKEIKNTTSIPLNFL